MRTAYLGFLLAACGRVGFDGVTGDPDGSVPAPDLAPCTNGTDHDEDLDGIDDACDLCPHVFDPAQANFDRDGLGDACDWDLFSESVLFFDPFEEPRAEWDYERAATVDNDQLVLAGVGADSYAALTDAPGLERIEMEGEIVAVATGRRQIALHADDASGTASYYCELYDGGSYGKIGLTYTFDQVEYVVVMERTIGRVEPGPVKVTLVNVRPNIQCIFEYGGNREQVGGFVPDELPGTRFAIESLGADTRIDYAIRITAN